LPTRLIGHAISSTATANLYMLKGTAFVSFIECKIAAIFYAVCILSIYFVFNGAPTQANYSLCICQTGLELWVGMLQHI